MEPARAGSTSKAESAVFVADPATTRIGLTSVANLVVTALNTTSGGAIYPTTATTAVSLGLSRASIASVARSLTGFSGPRFRTTARAA